VRDAAFAHGFVSRAYAVKHVHANDARALASGDVIDLKAVFELCFGVFYKHKFP
jgi:hypothetical protein